MSRRQFADCFTATKVADVAASATNNGTANSAAMDTEGCSSPTVVCDVVSLASSKTISLVIQDSDSNSSGWADAGTLEHGGAVAVSANGPQKLWYAGDKRYIRVKVTSTSASPGATVRMMFQKHNLYEKPENASF